MSMPEERGSISRSLDAWRGGDQEAALDLEQRLRNYVLGIVRSRRSSNLQRRINSEDVANGVFHAFLMGVTNGSFPTLENRQDVKRLLAHISTNMVIGEIRKAGRKKRDYCRDVPLSAAAEVADLGQPSPVDCCLEAENLDAFLQKLVDTMRGVHPLAIQIMELSLEGLTNHQIAEHLDLRLRTIQLIKQKMCAAVEGHGVADDDEPRDGR